LRSRPLPLERAGRPTNGFALLCAAVACLLLLVPSGASAHPIDSATLVLQESGAGQFRVKFQSGSRALTALDVPAVYPPHCRLDGETLFCGARGLSGTLAFPWLEGALTHLLVVVEWHDGSRLQRVVPPDRAELAIYDHGTTGWAALWPVLSDYGRLGVEHILLGFDHLCFVLALALLVKGRRRLVATITAFTLAHSVTLALSTLGLTNLPIAPVEASIALSIVLVCAEVLQSGDSLTRRWPWLVAFSFGLLHGFGFASALREVGLPGARLPSALLGFNLGVELGQLAVVLAAVEGAALLAHFKLVRPWMPRTAAYLMGSLAAYWSIDRVLAVVG
jgi:hydrogenase/urease accessory protein HupE